jgi:predicted amidophosphoribosyltransferase
VLDSLKSLKELLFPLSCLGCATADYWLCPTCQSNWNVSTRKSFVGSNLIYFKADYNVKTASVILAAKESNNHLAIDLLATSISQSILYAVADLGVTGDICLVTIPSSASAIRRRGRDHIQDLAVEVQKLLELKSINSHLLQLLSQRKNMKDQSRLNSRQRLQNTHGMFEVTSCENPQGAIFLIDDLVTTGASIMEGIRALFEAKILVAAAITACAVGRNSLIP